jgi:pilus assembly protein Flp/PilA
MFSKINEALLKLVVRTRDESGQALAEYGLIVGLIAVAAIIALGLLAGAITGQFDEIVSALNS